MDVLFLSSFIQSKSRLREISRLSSRNRYLKTETPFSELVNNIDKFKIESHSLIANRYSYCLDNEREKVTSQK